MSKQHINVGQSVNDKSGDPLRTAFQKINDNFDELYNITGGAGSYHLGDDIQFVDIDPNSGTIVIQSGFDTGMPVYIKGANCSDGGVGGNVVIEAGGAPLPNTGTTGNVEIAANQTTIDSNGRVWSFLSDGALETPDGHTILSDVGGLSLNSQYGVGLVAGRTGLLFESNGTVTIQSIFPVTFTAYLDTDHMIYPNPSVALVGEPWQMEVTFAIVNGQIETQVEQIFPILSNPGYVSGYTFGFTDADHGIPGYGFSIELQDVQLPGGAGWTANINVAPPPPLPSTIYSSETIKLTADATSWTFGPDGILRLPVGGDIQIDGQSVLGGGGASYNQSLNTTDNVTFNRLKIANGLHVPVAGGAYDKIKLYDFADNAKINYAIGTEDHHIWMSVDATSAGFKWYGGTNRALTLLGDGTLTLASGVKIDVGTANKFTLDQSTVNYIDLRDGSGRGFYTDSSGYTLRSSSSYSWIFDEGGILNLPNSTTGAPLIQATNEIQFNANGSTFTFGADGNLYVPNEIHSTAGVGDVVIESNDGVTPYTWTFDQYGNLSVPGSISNTDSGFLNLRGSNVGPTTRIHVRNSDGDPTSDVNIHLQTGGASNIFELFQLGGGNPALPFAGGLRTNSTTAPILIQTNSENNTSYTNITVNDQIVSYPYAGGPNALKIFKIQSAPPESIIKVGSKIVDSNNSSLTAIVMGPVLEADTNYWNIPIGDTDASLFTGSIDITVNQSNTWTFSSHDGSTTLPDTGDIVSGDYINLLASRVGVFTPNTRISLDDPDSSTVDKIQLITSLNNHSYTWTLDGDGKLTFPDLTSQTTAFQDVPSHIFFVHPNPGRTFTATGTYNSPFATITAAINAAVTAGHNDSDPAVVILMANITENITLKPGIFLTSFGTGTHGSPTITGTVTVTSSTGTTVTNHYSISNLRIVGPAGGKVIYFTGTAPQKLFVRDMWIDAHGTGTGIYMDNTGSGSTLQMDIAHMYHDGSGDIYCIDVVHGGCYVTDIETSGATQVAAVRAGAVLTIDSSELDAVGDVVCETYGNGTVTITNSIINNTQANGNGIKLNDAGGVATLGNNLISVPVGSGYVIQGVTGTLLYAANNVFLTANTARSTAITYVALPTTWSTKS